jgi:hypothetical protein
MSVRYESLPSDGFQGMTSTGLKRTQTYGEGGAQEMAPKDALGRLS